MSQPDKIILWLPRDDEHVLAASLGMCERDPNLLEELVEAAQEEAARTMPGVPVIVKRWHVWRVVRTMAKYQLVNSPDGRAAAYGLMDE